MVHVFFLCERSIDESNGIRKDARFIEMMVHPAHGPTRRYLPKTREN